MTLEPNVLLINDKKILKELNTSTPGLRTSNANMKNVLSQAFTLELNKKSNMYTLRNIVDMEKYVDIHSINNTIIQLKGNLQTPHYLYYTSDTNNATKFLIYNSDVSFNDKTILTNDNIKKDIRTQYNLNNYQSSSYYKKWIDYIKLNTNLLDIRYNSNYLTSVKLTGDVNNVIAIEKNNQDKTKVMRDMENRIDIINIQTNENNQTIDALKNVKHMNIRNALISLDNYNVWITVSNYIKLALILLIIIVICICIYIKI